MRLIPSFCSQLLNFSVHVTKFMLCVITTASDSCSTLSSIRSKIVSTNMSLTLIAKYYAVFICQSQAMASTEPVRLDRVGNIDLSSTCPEYLVVYQRSTSHQYYVGRLTIVVLTTSITCTESLPRPLSLIQ
jgi:hypothetical protein